MNEINQINPLFWLEISLGLLIVTLIAVLFAALPTLIELTRLTRSAEKLLDTLNAEIPATLAALKLTGAEIAELGKDVQGGVKSAVNLVNEMDKTLATTKEQVFTVQVGTRSALAGITTAWRTFLGNPKS